MILKLSVSELRGLMASGSVPSLGGAQHTATPAGDGRTKEFIWTGRAYKAGSDHDVDRVGVRCSRPVYADVPPMPEGFPEGVPHGDSTAAVFGRRFGEAFDSWLDAFDCVLRSLPGGDRGRRMLDMESYALTDTDAVVRVYRLEGGVRKGDVPFHEHRVHLKPRFVLGSGCSGYVDVVVSREVDSLVRGFGGALGFDDSQMARVRALVALEERPPLSRGSHGPYGTDVPQGPCEATGRPADEKVAEDGKAENADTGFGSRNADVQDYDIDDDRHLEGVGEDGGDEVLEPVRGRGGRKK